MGVRSSELAITANMVEAMINEGFMHDLRGLVNAHIAENLMPF